MLDFTLKPLRAILRDLYNDLAAFKKERGLTGQIGSGAWVGGQGSVVGWVDYLPHVDGNEEALEIGFDINPSQNPNKAIFEVSLCWSDGCPIQEFIAPHEIAFEDEDYLTKEILQAAEAVRVTILATMKDEMLIVRPPHTHPRRL